MKLPKELIKKLEQLERLDKKQKEILWEIDAIYKTSAVGQAPPIFHKKCDQLFEIAIKKAPIWNDIRRYVVPGTFETLWQKALRAKEFPYVVKFEGNEECTCITAESIRKYLLEIE